MTAAPVIPIQDRTASGPVIDGPTADAVGSMAIARIDAPLRGGLRVLVPVGNPAELIANQQQVREYVRKVLTKEKDYGRIPGTNKDVLLKPGAEAVTAGFGCVASPRIVEQEIDHFKPTPWQKRKKEWRANSAGKREEVWITEEGTALGLYRYVIAVDIIDQDGIVRGTGIGSCSSLESKYCDRPRDCENTILKMARKRAHIAGVLDAFGLSDEFTQDIDERHVAAAVGVRGAEGSAGNGGGALVSMPFGKSKGMAIQDMEAADLSGAISWAREKGKFADFIKAGEAELKRRSDARHTPAAKVDADPAIAAEMQRQDAGGFDTRSPKLDDEDDDGLPF